LFFDREIVTWSNSTGSFIYGSGNFGTMKKYLYRTIHILLPVLLLASSTLSSCKKFKDVNYDPEIEPLKQGFKTSAAIGYCASLAADFFGNGNLPGNVIIHSSQNDAETKSAILLVNINNSYPLPFNSSIGQITMAGIWGENSGVITVLFTDINILEAKYKFIGIHTIPVLEMNDGKILTLFAEQDIVIGEGSDTLIELNMGIPRITTEVQRLDADQPIDAFAAVKQNIWFITIDQNNTSSDIYDDEYTLYGGGQIVKVSGAGGGILYHAMIGAKFNYSVCALNPVSGVGFIQNLMVGTETDLGHIFLNFHDRCDGKAYIEMATGKYLTSNHRNVNLGFY
jgi:hypothetical protein